MEEATRRLENEVTVSMADFSWSGEARTFKNLLNCKYINLKYKAKKQGRFDGQYQLTDGRPLLPKGVYILFGTSTEIESYTWVQLHTDFALSSSLFLHIIYCSSFLLISDPISSYSSWEDKVDVECKKGVCDCDSAAALCFSQAVYNSSYVNYDTSKCQNIEINSAQAKYQKILADFACYHKETTKKYITLQMSSCLLRCFVIHPLFICNFDIYLNDK